MLKHSCVCAGWGSAPQTVTAAQLKSHSAPRPASSSYSAAVEAETGPGKVLKLWVMLCIWVSPCDCCVLLSLPAWGWCCHPVLCVFLSPVMSCRWWLLIKWEMAPADASFTPLLPGSQPDRVLLCWIIANVKTVRVTSFVNIVNNLLKAAVRVAAGTRSLSFLLFMWGI